MMVAVLRVSDKAFLNKYFCNLFIGANFNLYRFVADFFCLTTCVSFNMNICCVLDKKMKS